MLSIYHGLGNPSLENTSVYLLYVCTAKIQDTLFHNPRAVPSSWLKDQPRPPDKAFPVAPACLYFLQDYFSL